MLIFVLLPSEQKRREKAAKKAREKEEKAQALAEKQGGEGQAGAGQAAKKKVEDEESLDPRVSNKNLLKRNFSLKAS